MAEKRSSSSASKSSGGGSSDKQKLGKGAFWAFYLHLIVWFLCSFLLFTVNLLTTLLLPPWFLFPTIGWFVGVAIHGVVTALCVDTTCGSGTFWSLFNEKVLRNIPAEDIKNIAQATAHTAAQVAQKASAALQESSHKKE